MLNSNKQIKFGAVVSYISIAVNMLCGILYTPWMIRMIGQSDYGLYTLATSVISLVTVDFGMGMAVSRFLSKYRAEGKQEEANNFVAVVYKIYGIITLILLTALLIIYQYVHVIGASLTEQELEKFRVIFIIVAASTVICFPFATTDGMLTSYEKFVQAKQCDLFNRITTVLLVVIVLSMGYGLYALVATNMALNVITVFLKLYLLRRSTPLRVNWRFFSKDTLILVLQFSLWIMVTSLAQRLIINITPAILSAVSGSAAIAIFSVAKNLEYFAFVLTNAIRGMFMPKVSRMLVKNNGESNDEILSLMVKVGRFQTYIISLIIVGFIVVGKTFIHFWVGDTYQLSFYCFIFLVLLDIIEYPQQIADTTLIAANKVKIRAIIAVVSGMLNVILSLVLSSKWGAIGASCSIFIVTLFRMIANNIAYKRILNLDLKRFFKGCYLSILPTMGVALAVGLLLNYLFKGTSIILLAAKIAIIVVSYIVSAWFISFNEFEKNSVSTILNRIKK
jgi:O-antigen/teichoic acid export membrane protein